MIRILCMILLAVASLSAQNRFGKVTLFGSNGQTTISIDGATRQITIKDSLGFDKFSVGSADDAKVNARNGYSLAGIPIIDSAGATFAAVSVGSGLSGYVNIGSGSQRSSHEAGVSTHYIAGNIGLRTDGLGFDLFDNTGLTVASLGVTNGFNSIGGYRVNGIPRLKSSGAGEFTEVESTGGLKVGGTSIVDASYNLYGGSLSMPSGVALDGSRNATLGTVDSNTIKPRTDNASDGGSSAKRWKDWWVSGCYATWNGSNTYSLCATGDATVRDVYARDVNSTGTGNFAYIVNTGSMLSITPDKASVSLSHNLSSGNLAATTIVTAPGAGVCYRINYAGYTTTLGTGTANVQIETTLNGTMTSFAVANANTAFNSFTWSFTYIACVDNATPVKIKTVSATGTGTLQHKVWVEQMR